MARSPARSLDPDAVLHGTIRASIEDLFRMIHRVNPTGMGLPFDEEQRRYAQKSALQSLLLRDHADQLSVQRDPHDDDVISIQHARDGRDACHAVVQLLDDDVRVWVREQLHGIPEDKAVELKALPAAAPRTLDALERGRAALAEWDYEGAEAAYRQALAAQPNALAAALALLELLVDHLARDADAVELSERLPPAIQQDPACRRLVLAAALRLGRDEHALELLTGLDHPAAGDALHTLALRAVERADLDGARHLRARLADQDPAHPGVVEVDAAIDALRAELRAPVEVRLEALARSEDWAALLDAATRARQDWPHSTVASKLLHQARDALARAEAADLVAQAQGAGPADALRLLQRARQLGAEGLDARIATLEAAEAQRQRLARRVRLQELLESDRRAGLIAAASLAPDDRELLDDPVLAPLSELLRARRTRRPEQAVDAVLALEQARASADREQWQAVADTLEEHRDWLRTLAAARELYERALEQTAARRLQRARSVLEQAQAALDDGDLDSARDLLDDPALEVLDDGDAEAARALAAQVKDALQQRLYRQQLDTLLGRGQVVAARNHAAELAQTDPRWRQTHTDLQDQVREELRVEVFEPPPAGLDLRTLVLAHGPQGPRHCIDPWGEELYLAELYDRWLFVYALSLATGALVRAIRLRLPRPAFLATCTVEGESLVIHGHGLCLRLAPQTGEVLSCATWQRPPGCRLGDSWLGPGGLGLWQTVQQDEHLSTQIRRPDTGDRLRQLAGIRLARPMLGWRQPVVATYDGLWMRLVDGRGDRAVSAGVRERGIADMAAGVDGSSFVTVRWDRDRQPTHPVLFATRVKTGRTHSSPLGELEWAPRDTHLLTSPSQELLYVAGRGARRPVFLGLAGTDPAVIWEARAPHSLRLVSDLDGQRAALLGVSDQGHFVERLGPGTPDLQPVRTWETVEPRDMNAHADVLTGPPRRPSGGPSVRRFLQALTWADHCLDQGDAEAVIALLDDPVVWQRFEVQSRARLVQAWLQVPATDAATAWRRQIALSSFGVMRVGSGVRNVAGWDRAWGADRLQEVAQAAAAELSTC